MADPNATLYGVPQKKPDPNATLIGVQQPQYQYQQYQDPNATLIGQQYPDPNATLIGVQQYQDPNATLIGVQQYQDPNATLIGMQQDPNATLIGGSVDANSTLIGGGGPVYFNNSAQLQLASQPTVIPQIKLIPHNSYFPVVEREVLRTLKFGRQGETIDPDPDFVSYVSRVVSRRHAEIWSVNGEFYIRDTRSQTGTFLNAMRLSLPGEESKPFKLKNGDTIQLGVDRKGGTTPDTKCVSMACELSLKKSEPKRQSTVPQQSYSQPPPTNQPQIQPPKPSQQIPQQQMPQMHSNFSDLTLISNNNRK